MNAVFADTFFFLALLNRHDPAHTKALAAYGQGDYAFVTTAWVLTEIADALASKASRSGFERFYRTAVTDQNVTIIPASESLFHQGLDLYFSRSDKDWSLTDCISFTAMKDEGLTKALTGDHHFIQAGFNALLR